MISILGAETPPPELLVSRPGEGNEGGGGSPICFVLFLKFYRGYIETPSLPFHLHLLVGPTGRGRRQCPPGCRGSEGGSQGHPNSLFRPFLLTFPQIAAKFCISEPSFNDRRLQEVACFTFSGPKVSPTYGISLPCRVINSRVRLEGSQWLTQPASKLWFLHLAA